MDTLARRIGEMMLLRGATAAVARWGLMRVVGVAGLALAGYYLLSHHKETPRLLPAPDATGRSELSSWPGEDRRRAPELEPGMTYPGERRTLH